MPVKISYITYPNPQSVMALRDPGEITDLIYHHSAGSPDQTPREIDLEHRERGMAEIGYNYVIAKDGTIYNGRAANFIPAATFGRNAQSVNVCVLGNFQHDDPGYTGAPTPEQIMSAKNLGVYLHAIFPSIVRTIGHAQVAELFYPDDKEDYSTLCPGSEFLALLPAIKLYIAENLHQKT
jgi:hypothetical protein